MSTRRNFTLLSGVAAAVVGWGCERPTTPTAPDIGTPLFHPYEDVCPDKKFTGGGRIDPPGGKVTFGFNIFLDENCRVKRGQIQVNHHPSQSKFHAGTTSSGGSIVAASSTEECAASGFEGGVHVEGTVRVKHGNGDWHDHDFEMWACDNGEPGRDHDKFRMLVFGPGDGHGDTGHTPLTGGNIQAH